MGSTADFARAYTAAFERGIGRRGDRMAARARQRQLDLEQAAANAAAAEVFAAEGYDWSNRSALDDLTIGSMAQTALGTRRAGVKFLPDGRVTLSRKGGLFRSPEVLETYPTEQAFIEDLAQRNSYLAGKPMPGTAAYLLRHMNNGDFSLPEGMFPAPSTGGSQSQSTSSWTPPDLQDEPWGGYEAGVAPARVDINAQGGPVTGSSAPSGVQVSDEIQEAVTAYTEQSMRHNELTSRLNDDAIPDSQKAAIARMADTVGLRRGNALLHKKEVGAIVSPEDLVREINFVDSRLPELIAEEKTRSQSAVELKNAVDQMERGGADPKQLLSAKAALNEEIAKRDAAKARVTDYQNLRARLIETNGTDPARKPTALPTRPSNMTLEQIDQYIEARQAKIDAHNGFTAGTTQWQNAVMETKRLKQIRGAIQERDRIKAELAKLEKIATGTYVRQPGQSALGDIKPSGRKADLEKNLAKVELYLSSQDLDLPTRLAEGAASEPAPIVGAASVSGKANVPSGKSPSKGGGAKAAASDQKANAVVNGDAVVSQYLEVSKNAANGLSAGQSGFSEASLTRFLNDLNEQGALQLLIDLGLIKNPSKGRNVRAAYAGAMYAANMFGTDPIKGLELANRFITQGNIQDYEKAIYDKIASRLGVIKAIGDIRHTNAQIQELQQKLTLAPLDEAAKHQKALAEAQARLAEQQLERDKRLRDDATAERDSRDKAAKSIATMVLSSYMDPDEITEELIEAKATEIVLGMDSVYADQITDLLNFMGNGMFQSKLMTAVNRDTYWRQIGLLNHYLSDVNDTRFNEWFSAPYENYADPLSISGINDGPVWFAQWLTNEDEIRDQFKQVLGLTTPVDYLRFVVAGSVSSILRDYKSGLKDAAQTLSNLQALRQDLEKDSKDRKNYYQLPRDIQQILSLEEMIRQDFNG